MFFASLKSNGKLNLFPKNPKTVEEEYNNNNNSNNKDRRYHKI